MSIIRIKSSANLLEYFRHRVLTLINDDLTLNESLHRLRPEFGDAQENARDSGRDEADLLTIAA